MSSLYDKYHSEHNHNYMYNLIKNMIFKEHKTDISSNETYNHFFQTNFVNTFKLVDTEDIKDLNNHLLNTQLDYFQNFILKQQQLTTTEDEIEQQNEYIIHSFQRNINLKNSSRHNYRIQNPCKQNLFQIEKVIVPIEESSLFMNPLLTLSLDTKSIELHLRGTIHLRNRDYGIYTPFSEQSILLNSDICRIQLKNQLCTVRKDCDVFKITGTKEKKISLSCSHKEFKEGDYIRLCNFENVKLENDSIVNKQYRVMSVRETEQGIDLKLDHSVTNCDGLYVMNMSLQNTIHCTSPE